MLRLRLAATEFIGAFFLVLVVALSGNPFVVGLTLTVMVYAGAAISGGHYNPAVSFAFFLLRKLSLKRFALYAAAQILGGLAAYLVATYAEGGKIVGLVQALDSTLFLQVFIWEAIFTLLLVYTVLAVTVNRKVEGNQYFGLAIGLTIFIGGITAGAITGGLFNPAITLASAAYYFESPDKNLLGLSTLVYVLAQLTGATGAVLLNKLILSESDTISLRLFKKAQKLVKAEKN